MLDLQKIIDSVSRAHFACDDHHFAMIVECIVFEHCKQVGYIEYDDAYKMLQQAITNKKVKI